MSKEAAAAIEALVPRYGGDVRRELQEAAKITRGIDLNPTNTGWAYAIVMIPVLVEGEQIGHAGISLTLDSAMLILRTQFYPPNEGAKDTPVCVRETRVNPSDRNGYYAISNDGHNVTIADVWGGRQQVIDFDEWQLWEVWPDASAS